MSALVNDREDKTALNDGDDKDDKEDKDDKDDKDDNDDKDKDEKDAVLKLKSLREVG